MATNRWAKRANTMRAAAMLAASEAVAKCHLLTFDRVHAGVTVFHDENNEYYSMRVSVTAWDADTDDDEAGYVRLVPDDAVVLAAFARSTAATENL